MCAAVDDADMPEIVAFDDTLLREHIKFGMNVHALSLLDGADPHRFVVKHNTTILHLAAEYGNEELAQYLVYLGADVDAQNNIGETPLTIAVKHEQKHIIELLLRANADMTVRDFCGKCLLERAFDELEDLQEDFRHLFLDRVTIEYLFDCFSRKGRAFHDCIPFYYVPLLKNVHLTRVFLYKGFRIDSAHKVTKRTALHEAVRLLDVVHVRVLLKCRANVNIRDQLNRTPICMITEYKDDDDTVEIVKMLIDAGAILMYPEYKFSPMENMLSRGGPKIVRTVLESGRDLLFVNDSKSMPIDFLFENENPAVYQELTKFNKDLKMRFNDNPTLLHRVPGNSIVVNFLIYLHMKVNTRKNGNLMNTKKLKTSITDDEWMHNLGKWITKLLRKGEDPQIFTKDIDRERLSALNFDELVEGIAEELMKPVLVQLALQEAEYTAIDIFTMDQIRLRKSFKEIFDTCVSELEEIKDFDVGGITSLYSILVEEEVTEFAENRKVVEDLKGMIDLYDKKSYFYEMLKSQFLIIGGMFAINEIFVRDYKQDSAMDIAEKIVGYL